MKKIILVLLGISIILSGVILVLYKNHKSKNEEVIDIFKEEEPETNENVEENQKEESINIKKIVVDIKGMVASPGVYEVEPSSRVNDVINIAGGLLEGADTSPINLAKIVEDEMIIIIYSKEEVLEKYKEEICVCDCPEITNDACIENTTNEETDEITEIIDINTATKEELMSISGIGESKAEEIIKYRKEKGKFKDIKDIKKVSGIGDSLFEKIKDYIKV